MSTATLSLELERTIRSIPGYDPYAQAGDCWFDGERAEYVIDFIQTCCTFTQGEKAGQPFKLERWQKAIVANLFGWYRPNGTRRYRKALIYVPRKNGKSELMAALICVMLFLDQEPGAQLYSAAAKRDQTRFVFDPVRKMIAKCPEMKAAATPFKYSIVVGDKSYLTISREATTEHGGNTQFAVIDELHAQPDRELVDVLDTSTLARTQPMIVYITTADYQRESICNEMHEYAGKVRDGIIDDPQFLPVIYEATTAADWRSPKVWAAANPNLGVSISETAIAEQYAKAENSPAFENTFKRLHLNIQCVTPETLFVTRTGERKRADELQPGDWVLSFDEDTEELQWAYIRNIFDNGVEPVVKITTKRGRQLTTTLNHPYWCRVGRPDNPHHIWADAGRLDQGDRVGVALGVPPDGEYVQSFSPDESRFLGMMTGDGSCTPDSISLSTIDEEIVEWCEEFWMHHDMRIVRPDPYHIRFVKQPGNNQPTKVRRLLERAELYGCVCDTKRIPPGIFTSGPESWASFVAGYLDTDGCIATESVIFVSVNRPLLEDVQQLLALLGIQSNLRPGDREPKQTTFNGRTITSRPNWRLEIHYAEEIDKLSEAVSLLVPQKQGRLTVLRGRLRRTGEAARDRFLFDPVVSAEHLPPTQTIGITVEGSHTHITNGLITHNTEQETRWLDQAVWDACNALPVYTDGSPCYGGLDLSSTSDFTAFAWVNRTPAGDGEEDWYDVRCRLWVPEGRIAELESEGYPQYRMWQKAGLISAIPGPVMEPGFIRREIAELAKLHKFVDIGYDKWSAWETATKLHDDHGIEMVEIIQGMKTLSEPTKKLERLLKAGKVRHGGHPVLSWMFSNVMVKSDENDNIRPVKPPHTVTGKMTPKIDGIVALIMAIHRAMKQEQVPASPYATRGVRTIGG